MVEDAFVARTISPSRVLRPLIIRNGNGELLRLTSVIRPYARHPVCNWMLLGASRESWVRTLVSSIFGFCLAFWWKDRDFKTGK